MTTRTCNTAHHGECDRVMSLESVEATLHYHGVSAYISAEGIVWAFEAATRTVDGVVSDASEWIAAPRKIHALADWLGY